MNRNSSSLRKLVSAEILFGVGAHKAGGCFACAFGAQHHLLAQVDIQGIDVRGMDNKTVKQRLIAGVHNLKQEVALTQQLKEVGARSSDIPELSGKAIRDPCLLTNPCRSSKRDIEVVYEEAF